MTDRDDVIKSLGKTNEEIEAIIKINETIEKGYVKSKEADKAEDREFQIKILRLQLKYDNGYLTMTVLLGLIVSLLGVFVTITFSNIFPDSVVNITRIAVYLLIALTVLCALVIWWIISHYQKKDLDELRNQFIKKKGTETNAK